MANVSDVKIKKRTIDLGDGVERNIVLSLNAMAELEEKYGSIDEAFNKIKSGSVAAVRYLLWCCMVDDDPELTERQVGSMIRIDNMSDIMSAIMDAFEDQMPEGVTGIDPNQTTPAKVVALPNSNW